MSSVSWNFSGRGLCLAKRVTALSGERRRAERLSRETHKCVISSGGKMKRPLGETSLLLKIRVTPWKSQAHSDSVSLSTSCGCPWKCVKKNDFIPKSLKMDFYKQIITCTFHFFFFFPAENYLLFCVWSFAYLLHLLLVDLCMW